MSGWADPVQHGAAETPHRTRRQSEISFTRGSPWCSAWCSRPRNHPDSWCWSWSLTPNVPRWATWPIRTSAPSAASRIRRSLRSRLQPTPSWRFQTQKGWEGADPRNLLSAMNIFGAWLILTCVCVCDFLQQGSLQIYLKSKNGPIEVYLCPEEALEDASPVKSASTPKKEFPQTVCSSSMTATAPPSCSIKEEPVESKPSSAQAAVLNSLLGELQVCQELWTKRAPLAVPAHIPEAAAASSSSILDVEGLLGLPPSLLQMTEDQLPSASFAPDPNTPFVSFSPPLDHDDYLWSLDDGEGVSDFFDSYDLGDLLSNWGREDGKGVQRGSGYLM